MEHLKNFLEKAKKSLLGNQTLKEDIVSVIKEKTGIELLNKDISIINKKIKISAHPVIKNEIFLKKVTIISSLKEKQKNLLIEGII